MGKHFLTSENNSTAKLQPEQQAARRLFDRQFPSITVLFLVVTD
jgi:hypothetical protein